MQEPSEALREVLDEVVVGSWDGTVGGCWWLVGVAIELSFVSEVAGIVGGEEESV